MNAQEIIDHLISGKTVALLSYDAFEFMREVERHNIPCNGINMSFRSGQCIMTIEAAEYYCTDHKYSPPPNSGFALCPQCEMIAGNWGRE